MCHTISNETAFNLTWQMPLAMLGHLVAKAYIHAGVKGVGRKDNPDKVRKVLEMIKQRNK